MTYSVFHIFHLISVFLLVGVTFAAFASAQSQRRREYLILSGVLSLLVLISGFGLLGILKLGVPFWSWIKLACWLVLSALTGFAFRRPAAVRLHYVVAVLVLVIAVVMASVKPVF